MQRNLGGLSLAEYVSRRVLDPLTDGRHSILGETARQILQENTSPNLSSQLSDRPSYSSAYPPSHPFLQTSFPQPSISTSTSPHPLSQTITTALSTRAPLTHSIDALLALHTAQLDMAVLVRRPEEFFLSDQAWFGRGVGGAGGVYPVSLDTQGSSQAQAGGGEVMGSISPSTNAALGPGQNAGLGQTGAPEMPPRIPPDQVYAYSLRYNANVIERLLVKRQMAEVVDFNPRSVDGGLESSVSDMKGEKMDVDEGRMDEDEEVKLEALEMNRVDLDVKQEDHAPVTVLSGPGVVGAIPIQPLPASLPPSLATISSHASGTGAETDDEDKVMKHLRLNLLALAKRAPIEKVARLPKELVPVHIRGHIPVLED